MPASPSPSSAPITALLREAADGSRDALDRLTPLVYAELRGLARRALRSERKDNTLQATALVHEAYLRLVKADIPWQDRVHFFAVAARTMRRILVDHGRSRRRIKRGGGARKVTLEENVLVGGDASPDILDLDRALDALLAMDPRKGTLVELHYFGGLGYDEMAQALSISAATVHRELRLAKAWLQREMSHSPA